MPNTRLTRSDTDRLLAGVCGGIAAYVGVDPILIRAAFLILLFASGIGLPMYLIMWVIMPLAGSLHKSGEAVVQDNFEDMGMTVSKSMNRLGRPGTVGVILVSLGGVLPVGATRDKWDFFGACPVYWPRCLLAVTPKSCVVHYLPILSQ